MTEYAQRKELGLLQKTKVVITFDKGKKDKHADLFLCKPAFLVDGNKISKIEGSKIMKSDVNELNNTLANYRGGRVVIDNNIMKALKKELGNFDISL